MKKISLYTTEEELKLDLPKVYEFTYTPLTELQKGTVGFVPLFDDVLTTALVEGYNIFKVRQAVRQEPKAEAIENEFNFRLNKVSAQDVQVNMDELLQEVDADLTRMSNITIKDYLVVWDQVGKRFLVDGDRGKAEVCIQHLHNIFEEECQFKVLMTDPFLVQPLLTTYISDKYALPEPFVLDSSVKLGKKCPCGKKSPSANITIKNEDISSQEVLNHLAKNKVVHSLGLDYDGVIYFELDHSFMINAISYEAELKYKDDVALDAQDSFIAELTPIMPELSKIIDKLQEELERVK